MEGSESLRPECFSLCFQSGGDCMPQWEYISLLPLLFLQQQLLSAFSAAPALSFSAAAAASAAGTFAAGSGGSIPFWRVCGWSCGPRVFEHSACFSSFTACMTARQENMIMVFMSIIPMAGTTCAEVNNSVDTSFCFELAFCQRLNL